METKETVLFILGCFLIVLMIGMLVKIYYTVEQHGLQISVLLKHEKEGFVPWRSYVQQKNYSANYRNHLLPEGKQLDPTGKVMVMNNTRGQQPCHALTTEQLKRYNEKGNVADGLAGHATNAENLNITTEESLKTGNLNSMDVNTQSNYVESSGPAVDQTGIVQEAEGSTPENVTGNPRTNPAFLNSMTEGVKQANESSKERYRLLHRGNRF